MTPRQRLGIVEQGECSAQQMADLMYAPPHGLWVAGFHMISVLFIQHAKVQGQSHFQGLGPQLRWPCRPERGESLRPSYSRHLHPVTKTTMDCKWLRGGLKGYKAHLNLKGSSGLLETWFKLVSSRVRAWKGAHEPLLREVASGDG